jgi:hypothetical protein
MADAVSKSLSDLTKELSKSNNSARESEALRLKEQKAQLDQMEKDAEEKGIELKDNKKFRDAQLAHQKANLDFRSKNATSRAAQKEINKEKSKLQESYFKKYLGKNSFFGKGFSSIGNSLKKKVGGGIDSIFKALKAGAFILFLGGLKKFLESDLFQEMMDKIIPVVVTGLKNLRDVFNKFKENIPTMVEDAKEFVRKLEEEVLPKIKEFSEGFYSAFFYVKDKIFQVQAYMKTPEFKESFEKLKDFATELGNGMLFVKDKIIELRDYFYTDEFKENFQKLKDFAKELGEGMLFVKDEIIALKDYVLSEEFKENFTKTKKVLAIFTAGFGIIRDVIIGIYDTFWDEDGNFKGLEGVKEVISDVYDGFINFKNRIKEGFFDEDGNFSISAGFANIGIEISNITSAFSQVALALGAMLLLVKPSKFFGLLGVVGRGGFALGRGVLRGISSSFSKVFTALTGLGTSVSDLEVDMNTRNKNAKSGGVFSKKRGVGGKFGKLFRLVGRFGGLIAGVGIGMLAQLDLSKASGVLSDTAKGIGSAFKSLFSVVGDFAKSIGNVASKATAKVASVVADALSAVKNIGKTSIGTPQTKGGLTRKQFLEEIKAKRKLKLTVGDAAPKATTSGSGTGDKSPNYRSSPDPKPPTGTAPRLGNVDTKLPKGVVVNTKSASKSVVKKLTKAGMAKSLANSGGMLAIKMLPGIGIAAGLIFSASRLLAGDKVGAGVEFAGAFAPSLAGLPIDAGLMARDIYEDQFGIYPEQEQDSELRRERMLTIATFLSDKLRKQKALIGASPPALTAEKRAELIQKRSVFNYAATDLPSFAEYERSAPLLRVNPSFDRNGDGVYDEKEFKRAKNATRMSRGNESVLDSKGGSMFLAPTSIVTNNNQTNVMTRHVGDRYGYASNLLDNANK